MREQAEFISGNAVHIPLDLMDRYRRDVSASHLRLRVASLRGNEAQHSQGADTGSSVARPTISLMELSCYQYAT